jgi:hypothetical protein
MKNLFVILERFEDDGEQTLGEMRLFRDNELLMTCKTIELPWKNNRKNVSCVPKGMYVVSPYSSKKFPNVYELQDVPGRDYILIHVGNYNKDSNGCILVGDSHADINNDGLKDVTNSRVTLNKLRDFIKDEEFDIIIV